MDINSMLVELSQRMGVPPLVLNDDGMVRCMFQYNIEVEFWLNEDTNAICFLSELGCSRLEDCSSLLCSLLRKNTTLPKQFQPVYAYSDSRKTIVLCITIPIPQCTVKTLNAAITELISSITDERVRLVDELWF